MSVTLTIDHIGSGGDGVARTDAGPVFVPGALPGETVEVEIEDGRGRLLRVIEQSPDRVPIQSEAYAQSGVAPLQHWASAPYLIWKRDQVMRALAQERLETDVETIVACPPGTRRRIALHARRLPDGKVVLGFKARRSWTVIPLEHCPLSDPRLNAALPALARVAAPFLSGSKSAPTLHVTATDTGLDVDVTGVERRTRSADVNQRVIRAALEADLARLSLDGDPLVVQRTPLIRFGPAMVAIPPGAFLQASPQAEAAMAERTVAAVTGARKAADLFCGAGTFSFPLAQVATVVAADSSVAGIEAMRAAVRTAPGLKPITAEVRDLFRRPLSPQDLKGCEAVVFDPPRAGALEQSRQIALSGASTVVGVSCNPTTFARDARVLADAGFRLDAVTPVDQFLWSTHIELVGVFRR